MQPALISVFPKYRITYFDDILDFGRGIREHNDNLELVLYHLRAAGLTLNPRICHFLQRLVTFLGRTVSSDGIAVTEDCTKQLRI